MPGRGGGGGDDHDCRFVLGTDLDHVSPSGAACHPSYRGTCIPPDVSDADCVGDGGDGPHYVQERNIQVVGPDVFGLDGNDNGVGCESR